MANQSKRGHLRTLKHVHTSRRVGCWACCLFASAAAAQSWAPTVDSASQDVLRSEPIRITGKRVQRQGDIAGNVTTVDGQQLDDSGVRGQEDIWHRIPGLQANTGRPNQALPTLRGIGTAASSDLLGTQQATTGFYLEDVPFTDPFAFIGNLDVPPFDLEGIDILRGPQGVLYGSASLGGAINLRLRRPDLEEFSHSVLGRLAAAHGGGTDRAAYAMINAPLQAGVAGLRAVAYERRDAGYVDNLGTGRADANRLRHSGGRVVGELRPMAGTAVRALLLSQRIENADASAVSPELSRWQRATPTASSRVNEFSLAKLHMDTTLPSGHALTAIGAALDKRAAYTSDTTAGFGAFGAVYGPQLGVGPLPGLPTVVSLSLRPLRSRAISHELRLASPNDASPVNYLIGVFLQRTRFDWQGVTVAPGGAQLWGPAGALLPQDTINATEVNAHTRESAVYTDLEWRGSDGLALGLGGRSFRTAVSFASSYRFLTQTSEVVAARSEHGFTPKLSLKLRRGPHEAYALVSRGFRFGGVNLDAPRLTPYWSDSVWNRELGLRLVTGPASRLATTVYDIDWRDAQLSTLLPGPPPTAGVANAGRARSRGLETEWRWQPTSVVELAAALAWTDARTRTSFVTASGTPIPEDARLPGTPRWHSSLRMTFAFDGPSDTAGHFSVAHAAMSSRAYDLEGRSHAPGHGVLDLNVRLTRGSWELGMNVDNLFNAVAVVGAAPIVVPGGASFVEWFRVRPRTVALSVRHAI